MLERDRASSFVNLVFVDVNPSLQEPTVANVVTVSNTDIESILTFCDSSSDTLHMQEPRTPYLPSLFGYLLGYPTLYTNSQSYSYPFISSPPNGLSLQPLKLNKVVLQGFTPKNIPNTCPKEFEAYSFTFPTKLHPTIEPQVTQWWENFCKQFAEQKVWTKYELEVSDVCLEHILL